MDDGAATTFVQGGDGDGCGAHVLLLPFPGMQGHANPMIQLVRRLAFHGLRPTLVVSRHVLSTTSTSTSRSCPFPVAAISDGLDAGGISSCLDVAEYVRRMEAAGSDTLAALLDAEAGAGRPVRVLVYDSHLPWARRVSRAAGVAAAAFMTQMCAVDLVYGEAWAGRVVLPLADGGELRRSGRLAVEREAVSVRGMDFNIHTYRYRYKATAGVCYEAMMKLMPNTDGIARCPYQSGRGDA
ncbi:unnamed protein product [Miscanthus lutarioriparius]|uniref:Uncharacterized protein n=1 Tax=Miscanthus lutarioriparius TaxID=422564 RepID=A0A811PGG3_9POAL|nr:unnamed protein product [Miscanthus lutarioriparius]